MADAAVKVYANWVYNLGQKKLDMDSDALWGMLLANTYTPDYLAHDFQNDLSGELLTGNGYTAGGQQLTNVTWAVVTAANAPTWLAVTAYKVGQLVRKATTNGHLYRCIVAGVTGAAEPTWPTNPGEDVIDGTAKWEEAGSAYVKLDFDDVTWTPASITARYCVIVDKTPGTTATNPLICCFDLGQDRVSANSDFTVQPSNSGALLLRIA